MLLEDQNNSIVFLLQCLVVVSIGQRVLYSYIKTPKRRENTFLRGGGGGGGGGGGIKMINV